MYKKPHAFILIWALILLAPVIAQPEDKLVFIHTADLGDVIAGIHEDPLAPTFQEAASVLRSMKSQFADALFLDSGNFHGPLSMLETQFSPPARALMTELQPFAMNFASRDMLYSSAHLPGTYAISLQGMPITTTAEFPLAPADFTVKPIEKTGAGRSLRALGVSSLSRAKPVIGVSSLYENTDRVVETALEYLNNPATPAVELNLILSDLPPEENDALAAKLPANSLIFEQAIYGLDPGLTPPPVRKAAGITIISKSNWWTADVVEVQVAAAASTGGPLMVTAAKVVESKPYNPWFKQSKPSIFKRFFSAKQPPPPIRQATVELPKIGERLSSFNGLRTIFDVKRKLVGETEQDYRNKFQINEFRARGLPGADQRQAANFYFYRLAVEGKLKGNFVKVYRSIVPSMTTIVLFVGFDDEGLINHIHVAGSARMTNTTTMVSEKFINSFIGVSAKEISLKPVQKFGVEFHADYLVKDLRTACELYRQAVRRAQEVTDDQDFEDLNRK